MFVQIGGDVNHNSTVTQLLSFLSFHMPTFFLNEVAYSEHIALIFFPGNCIIMIFQCYTVFILSFPFPPPPSSFIYLFF